MSRRKQTKPRAIKRDASYDDDENGIRLTKKLSHATFGSTETIDQTNISIESKSIEDEQNLTAIKCDSCQESFLTSEQFNQHRLYQCAFLPEENVSDESQVSSLIEDTARQLDTIPHSTKQTEEYPHGCSYCQKSFSNMALLLKHEQVHVELMPFRCSFCGKGFKHRRSLNRHLKLHTGERKFKCTLCESTFARSDHLKAHIRTHNNNNNHHNHSNSTHNSVEKKAQVDSRSKTTMNGKNRRISSELKSSKDESQTEQCPLCPRICLGEESLKFHIQNDHQQSTNSENSSKNESSSDNYCYLCNAKFNSRENYLAHLRCTHPTNRANKSDSTSLIVPSANKSAESYYLEYALIEKSIFCEKCKRPFDSMNSYFQHYSIQHCLQMIKCLQCQDMFESIDSFFEHIEKVHPSRTVENLKCKLCNGSYKNRNDFIHHIKTSHQVFAASTPCPLCPFQPTHNVELIEHLKFVHKIDSFDQNRQPSFNVSFSCNFCPMKLNSRFELNHHILNEHDDHRHEKDSVETSKTVEIQCSFCELKFSNESSLSEHQRVAHRSSCSISSTFQCSYCQTSFTTRTQLDRHSRIHIAASGTNLKCNICDRLFSTIDILSEHKLSHCKATTSNICSHCHQTLLNENDFTRHLFEHNQHFKNHQDGNKLTIGCIVCKQSLINQNEIDLHAKFHLQNEQINKKIDSTEFRCQTCFRSSSKNRDFIIELSSFTLHCFDCLRKQLNIVNESTIDRIGASTHFSCFKCRENSPFDDLKSYEEHFFAIHTNEPAVDAFHCLKCNEIVSSREHVAQHSSNGKISPSKSFLIDNLQCSTIKRPHYCYLCRTNFETTNQIHLHLIEHQYPNRDYQCTLCEDQLFEDANQLYQHMIQHGNKSRVYPCRECDLLFMFSMHLINHQYSHTDATVLPLGISKPNGSSTIKDEDRVSWKSFVDRTSNEKRNRSVIVN